jgi:hypothetical protein
LSATRDFITMSFRGHDEPTPVGYRHIKPTAAERVARESNLVRLKQIGGDYDGSLVLHSNKDAGRASEVVITEQ